MCIGGNQAFGITHTINFKTMTTINTELLDQELTTAELSEVSGGLAVMEVMFREIARWINGPE